MARIRATRDSVNDRFNVLSFSVRSDNPLFEIGLATDPELLKPENRARRTPRTFFSSHVQPGANGREAMYLVPPSVVARFIGQPRLYFGLATYGERDRIRPIEVQMPDRGNMYVTLAGLTERGLRRTARIDAGSNGYGGDGAALAWGADAVIAATPAAATTNATDHGNGGYSDGYSDALWHTPVATAPPAHATPAATTAPNGPAATSTAPPTGATAPIAAAQGWRAPADTAPSNRPTQQGPTQARAPHHGAAPVNALRVVDQYDTPSDLGEALLAQLAFFASSARWVFGVTNTTVAPYSAICQVRLADGSEEGAPHGTAFFIAPRLLLTAAHVVHEQSALIIVPGKHDAGTNAESEPFGRFQVGADAWVVHSGYSAGSGEDFDLALIRVPEANAVAYPQYFDILEELTQSRQEKIVVSGYAAGSLDSSVAGTVVNAIIDPDRQHMHGGRIRLLPTDETFAYDVQSLGGTSGSPVYYIDTTDAPRARVVGVHVAQNDGTTNLGCRITAAKLAWIRQQAHDWSQAVSFSLGAPLAANGSPARSAASGAQPARSVAASSQRAAAPQRTATSARALIIGPEDVQRAQRYAPQWADVFNWRAPATVEQAVSARGMSIQRIAEAAGELNLDRYEVRCEQLPDGWTATALLEHLRLHLNDFVDTDYSEFIPYDVGVDDVRWQSSTPVGAVFKIDIGGPDNASVVGSLVESRRWRFTTVHTEWSGDHPVSGHREFGVRDDAGTAVFYTRGADRWTGGPGSSIGFFAADRLWKSFQGKLSTWIRANGGIASVPAPFSERFHPEAVRILYPASAQSLSTHALSTPPVHEYDVALIPQPDKRACWAAAMAMLLAYRRHASIDPETLAAEVGQTLSASHSSELLNAVKQRYGFTAIEQPSNTSLYHAPQQWAEWLDSFGPLWVVIVGAPHAVVLSGISGDLADPSSAIVNILNPWDTRVAFDNDPVAFVPRNEGYADWLPFEEFAGAFGELAASDYSNWRVLHLPVATAQAAALGDDRLRLAKPPATVRAQALEAASAAGEQREPLIPSRVAGTRMSVLRGSAGACRWSLDQLEGSKAAASAPIGSTTAAIDARIVLDDWPALDGAATPLPITLDFVADHGSVGDVRISAGTPTQLSHGVEVTARIEDADALNGVATLAVTLDYAFSGLAQGSPQARIALRLLGDGRHERSNSWVAHPADAVIAV